ncbi:hypothetical protein [Sphaerisporangium sp. NPDC051011]|uniref:hypothetical protein n=1 Tax=Sphaerisporangium sp. NPDC051011 TaxID=3155792 RepID=UPI0033C331AA
MTSNEIAIRDQRAEIDSWTEMVRPVGQLAADLAQTEFVPDSLRGRTAAVAAAILTGREMGVGPMVALRHIHVIKGKPGQSAELMRALVLAQGHQIRYAETTDTRCIVEGRRRGEEDWTRVMFTADQLKRAKVDLGGYPEDKLVARATARLCRRIFADVVAGMPYTTEELEDVDGGPEVGVGVTSSAAPPTPRRRTAQRRAPSATPPAAAEGGEPAAEGQASARSASPAEARTAPRAEVPAPPLPGEPGYDEPPAADPAPAPSTEPQGVPPELASKPQLGKINSLYRDIGWNDRADKLRATCVLVDRELTSSSELTKAEASALIDTLANVAAQEDAAVVLGDLLAETRARREQAEIEAEDGDDEVVEPEIVEDGDQ